MTCIDKSRRDAELLDRENRQKALLLDQSFIVQAPAGAGKTELLTQRYLGLLASVEMPEHIVAITFTRKAASEMRNRILQRLANASGAEPSSDHERHTWRLARHAMKKDEQHGWGVLDNPDRLRITTIDALCASLVRQMPLLSRFGGSPSVAENPEIHFEEAARLTLETVMKAGVPYDEINPVVRALAYLNNDAGKLQKLIMAMLASRDQWLHHVAYWQSADDAGLRTQLREQLTSSLRCLVEKEIRVAAECLVELQTPALMAAARYISDFSAPDSLQHPPLRTWFEPLGAGADQLDAWQMLAGMLLTGKGEPYKVLGKNCGLPDAKDAGDPSLFKAHKAAIKAACDYLREHPTATAALRALTLCPVPIYADEDIEAIETFVAVMIKAYGYLWGVFQTAGETDFVEVAQRALVALGDVEAPSDLALKLDYELRHLLVDEFQDTNAQQMNLLRKLTAGWMPGDGRTLFVVGDPMQSIYRFRKADVSLFLRARENGIGEISLQPLTLYRNNRSLPKVISWINAGFQYFFPEAADPERGMVPYSPAIDTKSAKEGLASGVFVHPIIVGINKQIGVDSESAVDENSDHEIVPVLEDDDGNELEAQTILNIIEAEWREDSEREIAVLIRARNHLLPLVTAIRRSYPTLRYEAVEIESLSSRQPIQDLLALTRALSHRGDRVNWLAVLRAPWCGLTLSDLFQLARTDQSSGGGTEGREALPTIWSLMQDSTRVEGLSQDGKIRLTHACMALRDAVENFGRLSLRRQVESTWLRLGGDLSLTSQTDRDDVGAYFRLLDKLSASGEFELDRLEDEIQELYATPSTDKRAGKLKFMTVHKSKGLEFDVVILSGLHRRGRSSEAKLLIWEETRADDGENLLVVAPYKRQSEEQLSGAESVPTESGNSEAIRQYINSLEKIREDQENRRVLYVAATRAVRALHLVGVAKAKWNKKVGQHEMTQSSVTLGSPLRILWPSIASHFEQALQEKWVSLAQEGGSQVSQSVRPELAKFIPKLQRLRTEYLPTAQLSQCHSALRGDAPPFVGNTLAISTLAPQVGSLTHRYLELIAQQGISNWSEKRIAELHPILLKWLMQQGHNQSDSQRGAVHVERTLLKAITNPTGRWILSSRDTLSASELALTEWSDEDGMRNHIVDRTFVEDNVRWIIDYKTAAMDVGDIDQFVAMKCKEYAPQLTRYAALFAHEQRVIKKAIYFVDLNRFEVLD